MASISLYPPVVNNTEPAFVVGSNSGTLRINFYLSALTEEDPDNLSVQVKITNSKNVKVINSRDGDTTGTVDNTYRLRRANIILNLKLQRDQNTPGLYYIELQPQDVTCNITIGGVQYVNWYPGWIYKVQIRLSSEVCDYDPTSQEAKYQEAWLFQHQDSFSEWSTVIYAKAIPPMKVSVNGFDDSDIPPEGGDTFTPRTLTNFPSVLVGKISPGTVPEKCPKEYYKKYEIKLKYYTNEAIIDSISKDVITNLTFVELDDSGELFPSQDDKEKISYQFKRKMRNILTTYSLSIFYETLNGYTETVTYYFNYQLDDKNESLIRVITAEDIEKGITILPSGTKFWQMLEDFHPSPEEEAAIKKVTIMPAPIDQYNINEIIQYKGETTEDYIQDAYYQCIQTLPDERYTVTHITNGYNKKGEAITVPIHQHDFDGRFSIGKDEEEGRISLKLQYTGDTNTFANYAHNSPLVYCIKRADSRDGFLNWTPIHYGVLPPVDNIKDVDEYANLKFDYTVESGLWYKYALEELDGDNIQRQYYPDKDNGYIIRVFEHSYLLGMDGRQMKIAYDPSVSSYGYSLNDVKLETIGGKYPYTSRNTSVYYKTFPIGGMIASQSDEEGLFFNKETYYNKINWEDGTIYNIAEKYRKYAENKRILNRDFTLERDFREEVLKFLTDGKPKLFKSATEGNIIVRLMDISLTPTQNLSRLVASFSGNANEIDDYTMENCLKYGFYYPGTAQEVLLENE